MNTSPSVNTRVHVINLDRTPERFAEFMSMNAIPGVEFVRIKAVDGNAIDRKLLASEGIITENLIFTNNSIACALSHMRGWKIALDNKQAVTICEDDAILHPDFHRVYQNTVKDAPDADIIYWGYNLDMHIACDIPGFGVSTMIFDDRYFTEAKNIRSFQESACDPFLYRSRRLYGALCYTITLKGATKLLNSCIPLKNERGSYVLQIGLGKPLVINFESWGIDIHMGVVALPDIFGYAVVPPVVISQNDKTKSTIGGDRRVAGEGGQ